VTPRGRKFWGGLVGLGNCFALSSAVIGASGRAGSTTAEHSALNEPIQPAAAGRLGPGSRP